MHYFILGGTGFIGRHLINRLLDNGHEVTALVRNTHNLPDIFDRVNIVHGDPLSPGPWQKQVADKSVEVVVNLIGCPIIRRWTTDLKEKIFTTRILSTRMVAQALEKASPRTFFCANAIGYYGDQENTLLEEGSSPGNDFLAEVCLAWQREAERVQTGGHRVLIGRFAPVIGKKGGMLAPMLPIFKAGLGGVIGNGKQWLSWIHVEDLCRALIFSVENEKLFGPINMVAPTPVTNTQFTKKLATALRRPAWMRVPTFALRLIYGKASEVILCSQRAVPTRLEQAGFSFIFQEISTALDDTCG